jgi:hypothetical protein
MCKLRCQYCNRIDSPPKFTRQTGTIPSSGVLIARFFGLVFDESSINGVELFYGRGQRKQIGICCHFFCLLPKVPVFYCKQQVWTNGHPPKLKDENYE